MAFFFSGFGILKLLRDALLLQALRQALFSVSAMITLTHCVGWKACASDRDSRKEARRTLNDTVRFPLSQAQNGLFNPLVC